MLKFMWFTRNDLANKLRILLSVADFANHAKFVFFVAGTRPQTNKHCNVRALSH